MKERDLKFVGAETSRRKALAASYDGRRQDAGKKSDRLARKRDGRVSTVQWALEDWACFGQGVSKTIPGRSFELDDRGTAPAPTEAYHFVRVEAAILLHALQCSGWHRSMPKALIERNLRRDLIDHYRRGLPADECTQRWPGGGIIWRTFAAVVEAELKANPYVAYPEMENF